MVRFLVFCAVKVRGALYWCVSNQNITLFNNVLNRDSIISSLYNFTAVPLTFRMAGGNGYCT